MGHERRHSTRQDGRFPVKFRCKDTGLRYRTGWTCNLSDGGLLLEVDGSLPPMTGGKLRLGIGGPGRPGILRCSQLVEARVVRAVKWGNHWHVALAYDQVQPLPLARAG